ncbi:helix-turn-helix domain-containing protein [Sodalis sp. RH14]|uniref:helix-turn-helix domain-containing protein n=1 Tax=Sodalis sp. RH14 TaxID=3394329 RepID=UPI0039B4DE5C
MTYDDIISDLLNWLESHIDQQLSLDAIAAKAGYSKWHLQRIFLKITGSKLGTYVRERRLSKAALALYHSSRSILDIALEYGFDSQQSFSRAFKKQFLITPDQYRKMADWDTVGLRPPIQLHPFHVPQPALVMLPRLALVRLPASVYRPVDNDGYQSNTLASDLRGCARDINADGTSMLYGLHHLYLARKHKQQTYYSIAAGQIDETERQAIFIETGIYARFTYNGPSDMLPSFIMKIYENHLPALGFIRRQGYDITRFHALERTVAAASLLQCDYFIPWKEK